MPADGGKIFEAYLVAKQKSFPKIHQLVTLLDLCAKHDASFAELKQEAAYLSEYYVEMRYPADVPEYPRTEAAEALVSATKVRDFVKGRLDSE
jgi:HEPN domain-containing protein